ncbi:MAG: carbohydrate binding family 9 domain-containing protein, partial [Gammaproteobacteria bacterium]
MALTIAAAACCWAGLSAAAEPEFRALKVSTPPVMDGRLDDPAWQQAPVVDQFFEVYPHALAPSTYPTEVRILYDDRYLYVGFRAADPDPSQIRSHYVRRDRLYRPNSDDYVHIYLDALDTGKSAQMFAMNVQGNQLDGIWSEDSQTEDYTPDFDWQSYTARDEHGWTAVMRIPFISLRYRPGRTQTWKLIAWRGAMRDNFYQEASTRIPADNNCLMCYAGDVALDDFPTDTGGGSLVLIPEYTLTHSANSGDFGDGSNNHGNLGGYLTWQPRAGTVVDGALNPDFSQVESDDFQPTANNQFALFFPEKRPFFLESSNLLNTPIQAIYTRTVNAPRWGARLTQQLDSGSDSLLATQDKGGGSIIEPGLVSS